MLLRFVVAGLLVSTTAAARADLLSISGPQTGNYCTGATCQEYLEQGWTQTARYSNVSITASLEGTGSENIYLTTAIGPGATSANVVASSVVSLSASFTTIDLFSGLTLSPGTYYLVIAGTGDDGWQFTSNSNITTAAGITYNGGEYSAHSDIDTVFPPDSVFHGYTDTTDSGILDVTGTPSSATPEPGTFTLLGSGLLSLAGAAFRKRSTGR